MLPQSSTISEGWIKSPGHRKNLEGAFDLCCIGALAHHFIPWGRWDWPWSIYFKSSYIMLCDLYIIFYYCIMIRLLKFLNNQSISGFWFQWSNAVGRIYEQISGWASLNFQTVCSWSILRHQSLLVASEGVWTFSDGHTWDWTFSVPPRCSTGEHRGVLLYAAFCAKRRWGALLSLTVHLRRRLGLLSG